MGLVLDSSVLIAAEREKLPVSQLLSSLKADRAETRFVLSSITVMELEHGWHRAQNSEVALKRRRYLDEVFTIIPTEPFTAEMGRLAGKVDAEMKKVGRVIDRRSLNRNHCPLLWLLRWDWECPALSDDSRFGRDRSVA